MSTVRSSRVRAQWGVQFWLDVDLEARRPPEDRWTGNSAAIEQVEVSVLADGDPFWAPTSAFRQGVALDPIIDRARGEARPPSTVYTLRLTPGSSELCNDPAGPALGSPADASPTRLYELKLRPLEIDFELNEQFEIVRTSVMVRHDARWSRAPHGAAFVENGPRHRQTLHIDWKPDSIRRGATGSAAHPTACPRPANRARPAPPSVLVLHSTARMGNALNTFLSPTAAVRKGIHYIVDLDGHVVKMVHEDRACNHTGTACWRGVTPLGNHAIGIEHVHPSGSDTFPSAQIEASKDLVGQIVRRYNIRPWNVVGHADIAGSEHHPRLLHPSRRVNCPGLVFPWDRYAAARLVLPSPRLTPLPPSGSPYITYFGSGGAPLRSGDSDSATRYGGRRAPNNLGLIAKLQSDLASYGWAREAPINGNFDDETKHAVKRFQARFMQSFGRPNGRVDAQVVYALDEVLLVAAHGGMPGATP